MMKSKRVKKCMYVCMYVYVYMYERMYVRMYVRIATSTCAECYDGVMDVGFTVIHAISGLVTPAATVRLYASLSSLRSLTSSWLFV